MIQLQIKTDFKQVQNKLKQMPAQLRDKVMARSLNRTLDQAKTKMVREVGNTYNMPIADIRKHIGTIKAVARANGLEATLFASPTKPGRRSLNAIHFMERKVTLATAKRRALSGTKEQLHIKVKRTGSFKPIMGAFIGNKGRTVFIRIGGSSMASRDKSRGPKHKEAIQPVQRIDYQQMFNTRAINGQVVKLIQQKLPEVFEREARYYMSKL